MTEALFVETHGPAGAPPLLLVHGFGATNHFWRTLIPDLAQDHHVHAVELMGFGRSPVPPDGDLSPMAQGRALARYLETVRESNPLPPILMGHSLGGAVVMIAALEGLASPQPHPCRAMVVMSGAVFPQGFPPYIRLTRTRGLGELLLLGPPPRWAFRIGFRGIVHDPAQLDDAALDGYLAPLQDRDRRDAILQAARQLDPEVGWALQEQYPLIKAPVLALWGNKDRVVSPDTAHRLARMIPQTEVVILPNVGHLPPEEAPAQTITEIRRFLGRIPAASGATPAP
jgi:pimeloyl-ACP methyl ester carboxylesterase